MVSAWGSCLPSSSGLRVLVGTPKGEPGRDGGSFLEVTISLPFGAGKSERWSVTPILGTEPPRPGEALAPQAAKSRNKTVGNLRSPHSGQVGTHS